MYLSAVAAPGSDFFSRQSADMVPGLPGAGEGWAPGLTEVQLSLTAAYRNAAPGWRGIRARGNGRQGYGSGSLTIPSLDLPVAWFQLAPQLKSGPECGCLGGCCFGLTHGSKQNRLSELLRTRAHWSKQTPPPLERERGQETLEQESRLTQGEPG